MSYPKSLAALLPFALAVFFSAVASAQNTSSVLQVFSNSGVASQGNFSFSTTNDEDLAGSQWGLGLDERDVYHAAIKHVQPGAPASSQWEMRIGQGGQIYSITSEVGEIVPPQSLGRPFMDEVFQSISVDTSPRETGEQASFYHQAGYYSDFDNVTRPTFSPLLASGSVDSNSYSTLSLAVQADTEALPQQPGGLLNYQRTRDLGGGVVEVTHGIYNFGSNRVNFHNLPWGGVRRTVFDNMLVSDVGGGFTNRAIDDFANPDNQVLRADQTGGWAAFTEGTDATDRGLAYVFGDTDTHLGESWQANRSSWRWGQADGDILGLPIRNFNVGTFRREVDVDPGDFFESRYFLVTGDIEHIEMTIEDRDLVASASYDKVIIEESESQVIPWDVIFNDGQAEVAEASNADDFDFGTLASPGTGSQPLFLFEDAQGNEFISVDPYAISDFPWDGETTYKGILGFVLPQDRLLPDGDYVEISSLFGGSGFFLPGDSGEPVYGVRVEAVPEPTAGVLLALLVCVFGVQRRKDW